VATRQDTLDTTQAMIAAGADLIVIVSGDGTYNDALAGMKAVGVTLPIFGIAAGRVLGDGDVVTVEVVRALGQKARPCVDGA
jgi:predicted polyphosphate/ATP-dependent NAD kinase